MRSSEIRPIRQGAVRWTEGFWANWFGRCRQSMIPNMWRLLREPEISHAFENLRIAAGLAQGEHHGPPWHDGDLYKWLEATAHVYAVTPDAEIAALMECVIQVVGQAQREDGYIHTPVLIRQRNGDANAKPFTARLDFETYNMGHLMTAGVVHHAATGQSILLEIAQRSADYLLSVHHRSPHILVQNAVCPSHYMGLVELGRETGDQRYIALAAELIDRRDSVRDGTDQNQDRVPLRQQLGAVGHAVRANYLFAGAADVCAETGDPSLLEALRRLWQDMASSKVYITGGCGALYDGVSPDGTSRVPAEIQQVHQAYGRPFQLPQITAHNETCANIGNALWSQRMFWLTGEATYADMVETVLYNSALSGISLDGTRFFYTNPLRVSADLPSKLRWSREREPYISCFCCPPNLVRTIASSGSHAYAVSHDAVWVTLYGANTLRETLGNGSRIALTQTTTYPWDGHVHLRCDSPGRFAIKLRIPGWARGASLALNGRAVELDLAPGSFATVNRTWSAGDALEMDLPMPIELLEANPLVEEAVGQVAARRGPIVYCLESADLAVGKHVSDIALEHDVRLTPVWHADLLGGIVALEGVATARTRPDWRGTLYRPRGDKGTSVPIRLIPYYAWANRGAGEMSVWLPIS